MEDVGVPIGIILVGGKAPGNSLQAKYHERLVPSSSSCGGGGGRDEEEEEDDTVGTVLGNWIGSLMVTIACESESG